MIITLRNSPRREEILTTMQIHKVIGVDCVSQKYIIVEIEEILGESGNVV